MMFMTAGPKRIMKRVGKMKKMSGKRIFTGIFIACSSARWRRFIPILSRTGHRSLKSEARLNGDQHLVKCVRQLLPDFVSPLLSISAYQQVRSEVAKRSSGKEDREARRLRRGKEVEQAEESGSEGQ